MLSDLPSHAHDDTTTHLYIYDDTYIYILYTSKKHSAKKYIYIMFETK